MTAREWLRSPEAVEVAARAISVEGGGPGSSLHSWRCEYPDRYGDCTCVHDTAETVLTALLDRMPDPTSKEKPATLQVEREQARKVGDQRRTEP